MGEEEAVEEEQGGEQEALPPETEKGEEGQVLFQNFTCSTLVYTGYAFASIRIRIRKYVCARKPLRCIQEEKAVGAEELPEEPTREDGGAGILFSSFVPVSKYFVPGSKYFGTSSIPLFRCR